VLAAVRERVPECRVRAGRPRRRPDLAVFTDLLAPDPERHRGFATRGVPQLVVRMADELGLVGPLVLPGRTACLRCLDLHRAAADPHWPTVAARLAGWVGSGSPATLVATAALAAEQALLAVDAVFRAEPAGHPGHRAGAGPARRWVAPAPLRTPSRLPLRRSSHSTGRRRAHRPDQRLGPPARRTRGGECPGGVRAER